MRAVETIENQQQSRLSHNDDVLTVGERLLDRLRAISREIIDRVRQLTGESPRPDES